MFRLDFDEFAKRALRSGGMRRLGGALIVSLAAHALLLSWPVSLSMNGVAIAPLAAVAAPSSLMLRTRLQPSAADADIPIGADKDAVSAEPPQPTHSEAKKSEAQLPLDEARPPDIPLIGYYPSARLSKMPEAIGLFDIQPPTGGDTGLGGKMTVRLWIGATGDIDRASILTSGLPQAYADAAIAAFEKLRFRPGEIGGVPVKSWAEVVIEYADFQDASRTADGTK